MTVYQAYYDASGCRTAPDEPLVVTGVLAKQSEWKRFDEAWYRGLTRYGLRYIHLAELVNPNSPIIRCWRIRTSSARLSSR